LAVGDAALLAGDGSCAGASYVMARAWAWFEASNLARCIEATACYGLALVAFARDDSQAALSYLDAARACWPALVGVCDMAAADILAGLLVAASSD
jgi:hypothetical protein